MIPETRRERAGWTLAFLGAAALWLTCFIAIIPGCASTDRVLPPIDLRLPKMLESAVFIEHPGQGCGSAFVVSSKLSDGLDGCVPAGKWRTLVLTAGHMLELDRPIHAHDAFGNDMGDARAYWNCQFFDMAMIEFDTEKPMAPVKLRGEPVRAGEHVWLCGFPWGQPAAITEGYVGDPRLRDESIPGLKAAGTLTLVLYGNPGNSGSAVYDDNGEVIGILTLGYTAPGGLNGVLALAAPGAGAWVDYILGLEPPYWARNCGNAPTGH